MKYMYVFKLYQIVNRSTYSSFLYGGTFRRKADVLAVAQNLKDKYGYRLRIVKMRVTFHSDEFVSYFEV